MIPTYSLRPSIARALVPHALITSALLCIFAAGVFLNIKLLTGSINIIAIILTSIVMIIVLVLDLILYLIRTRSVVYEFYTDRIIKRDRKPEEEFFSNIKAVSVKKNLWDRAFGTMTVVLTPRFRIKHVFSDPNLIRYINSLIQPIQRNRGGG